MTTLTVPPDRPVRASVVAVLSDIAAATRSAGISYFVGGAQSFRGA